MRVGLLTQWYDPEPGPAALPGVLARGLAARGHEVKVLTGFPNYPTGSLDPGYRMRRRLDEVRDGIPVRRVALYPSHDASTGRRLANYGSFALSALASGLDALRDVEVLWVNYSPVTVALPMWPLHYGRRVPCVLQVSDLWPDTVMASGFGSSGPRHRLAWSAMNAWCRAMYAAAHSVAVISPGVCGILAQRGVDPAKVVYAPMWADEALFYPSEGSLRKELGIDETTVVVLYAGTLGEAQGLESLIDACATLGNTDMVCLIAGSGVSEMALRRLVETANARNIRFLGRVAVDRITRLMATGDVHFVGLRKHPLTSVTMPSKVQATLAAGRAVIASLDGDAAATVCDSGAGWVAPPGDAVAVAAAIRAACREGRSGLSLRGKRARRYYEDNFAVDTGVTRMEQLLEQAATSRKG